LFLPADALSGALGFLPASPLRLVRSVAAPDDSPFHFHHLCCAVQIDGHLSPLFLPCELMATCRRRRCRLPVLCARSVHQCQSRRRTRPAMWTLWHRPRIGNERALLREHSGEPRSGMRIARRPSGFHFRLLPVRVLPVCQGGRTEPNESNNRPRFITATNSTARSRCAAC
jgi:hypothetical protein